MSILNNLFGNKYKDYTSACCLYFNSEIKAKAFYRHAKKALPNTISVDRLELRKNNKKNYPFTVACYGSVNLLLMRNFIKKLPHKNFKAHDMGGQNFINQTKNVSTVVDDFARPKKVNIFN